MSEYLKELSATKAQYPFRRWADSGMEQYTEEACADFVRIFDALIASLAAMGKDASEEEKLEAFEAAIFGLNELDAEDHSLIETGECGELCALCNAIATAAGMDPTKYGEGEGPASEWREW